MDDFLSHLGLESAEAPENRGLVVQARAGGEVDAAGVHELLPFLLRRIHVRVPEPDLSAESTPTGRWCQMKQVSIFTENLPKVYHKFS